MGETIDGLLKATATRIFADHVTPAVLGAAERGVWPAALWDAIAAAGLDRAMVPQSAGGSGFAPAEALSLLRHAGAAALPVPLAETMLAGWLLADGDLPIPEGPLGLASGAGLTVEECGGGWRIRGEVHAVAWGREVAALAFSLCVKDTSRIALIARGAWHSAYRTNLAGEPRDTISLDLTLPNHHLVPAKSDIGAVEIHAAGAVTRALLIAGALEKVCAMTISHAQDRKQFGKPIGRFQAVQQNLAILAGQAAAAGAAADMCAEAFAPCGGGPMRIPAIAAGKARASEAAGVGAALAHQIHGAIGFAHEHSLHRLTRRLWAWRDEYGTEAEWNLRLGRHIAALGHDRLWAGITAL